MRELAICCNRVDSHFPTTTFRRAFKIAIRYSSQRWDPEVVEAATFAAEDPADVVGEEDVVAEGRLQANGGLASVSTALV